MILKTASHKGMLILPEVRRWDTHTRVQEWLLVNRSNQNRAWWTISWNVL